MSREKCVPDKTLIGTVGNPVVKSIFRYTKEPPNDPPPPNLKK